MREYHFVLTLAYTSPAGMPASFTSEGVVSVKPGVTRQSVFKDILHYANDYLRPDGTSTVTFFSLEPNELLI